MSVMFFFFLRPPFPPVPGPFQRSGNERSNPSLQPIRGRIWPQANLISTRFMGRFLLAMSSHWAGKRCDVMVPFFFFFFFTTMKPASRRQVAAELNTVVSWFPFY